MDGISPSASVESERSAQVCDRCRKRKVKCDGQLPACANCAAVGSECQFSTQLRRNTKRRGHAKDKDETIRRLQAEIADLRVQLQARNQLNSTSPQSDLDAFSINLQSQALAPQHGTPSSIGRWRPADDVSQSRRASSSGPVLRHLGRLVCGEDGVEIFAGSTTGVHFILSAQQKYQEVFSMNDNFPEAVFSLQLFYQGESRRGEVPGNRGQHSHFQRKYGLYQPREYYFSQIERYFELWGQLYPILMRKQFLNGVHRLFNPDISHQSLESEDIPVLYQLYIVLALAACENEMNEGPNRLIASAHYYYSQSSRLHHPLTARGDLKTLQGLCLLVLYFQRTARHHSIIQTVGAAVRLAQALGLHRHARRFKFCIGETETRKRVWWSIYILDVITSLHYGFPKLINDEDDDNDLPVDSDFEDIEIAQLPLPLPGEDTKFGPFLYYIKLAKTLSTCLKQLYTTTRRRQGVEKIASLTRELQTWESAAPSIDGLALDLDDVSENQGSSSIEHGNPSFILLWLRLLSLAAMMFVHRPALTYESTQPQFSKSLKICVDSASKIISMLHHYRHEYRLLCMSPIGPSIIFQSALLCLYEHWHSFNAQPSVESHEFSAVVLTAAELLDNIYNTMMTADQRTQGLHLPLTRDPPEAPLAQASWTLRYLLSISGAQAMCNVAGNGMPGLASPDGFVVATSSSHTAKFHTQNSASIASQVGISQGLQNIPIFPDLTGYSLGDLSSTGLEDLNEMNHNVPLFLWQMNEAPESLDMNFPVT